MSLKKQRVLWFKSLWAFFQSHRSRVSGSLLRLLIRICIFFYVLFKYNQLYEGKGGFVYFSMTNWPRTIACNCRSIQSVMRDINLTILPQPLYFWENEMEPILARPFLTVRKRIYLCALFCVIYNLSLQACYYRKSIFRFFKDPLKLLSMCKRLSVLYHKCLSYIQIIITIINQSLLPKYDKKQWKCLPYVKYFVLIFLNHILSEYICLDNVWKEFDMRDTYICGADLAFQSGISC